MGDASSEIVYTGAAKPPSWGERLIRAHTPEAHYQDIMKKYFWVTDRLEGQSLELAQRVRPTVELYAKAAGWSQTITELYLAGSALAITAILAGKGLKSAAGVFGEMARRHGSIVPQQPSRETAAAVGSALRTGDILGPDSSYVMVDYTGPVRTERPGSRPGETSQPLSRVTNLLGPGEKYTRPPHIRSKDRFAGFSKVTARIRDDRREVCPPTPAKPRPPDASRPPTLVDLKAIAYREMMKTVGVQAAQFGEYLKEHLVGLSDEQRRHAQRALAHILKNMLSENGNAPLSQSDPKKAFLDALVATMPRGESLSSDSTNRVFEALQQFNTL